jgi:hydrophobic/amphiphilic exporter-1 (mainly G- bacteria), HAE1 family
MAEQSPDIHYRISIRRPVTVGMLFLSLVVFGWKSYQELPINLMPDISYPTLTVRTEYEGAAPEDVEKLLTRPLEETLSIVGGMVEISSISSPGLSEVILEFTWDSDMNLAQQEVRDRLDLFEPPKDITEKPVILRYDPTLDPVMRLAITGRDWSEVADLAQRAAFQRDELTTIREAAERYLKSDLEAQAGIAQVLVKGGREQEVQILVDAARLKNLGLSLDAVVTSLAQQNINLSGGSLKEGRTEYLVRTLNEFRTVEEIGAVILGIREGRELRLDDVAQVYMGEKERETIVRLNGREAVAMDIYKEGDANTVTVANKLKDFFGFERELSVWEKADRRMKEQRGLLDLHEEGALPKILRSRLPQYAQLTLVSDQSRFIVASIKEVRQTAILGGFLALIILFFFLRDIKSTAIIGISIPISVIATFVPMFIGEVSLNIMSLGGLALGVGMLVDNSIVVLESIFRCREEGDSVVDAAERGTKEVASAVTASTMTTVAVFLPITFVEGIAGQLFRDLALTVTFSLLASLLVALFLIPMIASRQKLRVLAGENAVWLFQSYREARERHRNPLAASLYTFPYAVRSIGGWFRVTSRETFGPVGRLFQRTFGRQGRITLINLAQLAGVVIAFPVLILLFIFQILLHSIGAVLVTALFVVSVVLVAIVYGAAKLAWWVLWVPLSAFNAGFQAFRGGYAWLLRQLLHFGPVIIVLVALLSYHAFETAKSLGQELIPPMKQGEFGITMTAAPGTRLEDTEARARVLENVIRDFDVVNEITVEVGSEKSKGERKQGENTAKFTISLINPERNAARQDEIVEQMRARLTAISPDEIVFTTPTLFSFKTAVELLIAGDSLQELKQVGERVLEVVANVDGVTDADLSLKRGYPEVLIELDRDLLAAKGLSPIQVAERLSIEVQGNVATRFSRRGEKIDVRVRSDQDRLNSLEDLRMLSITDGATPTQLSSVATITLAEGPSEIRRVDQRQVVVISANVQGRDLGSVSHEILRRAAQVEMPEDFTVELSGQNRERETSYRGLMLALGLAVFLVYVVMASQFESIWHPALIMFTVPLAFVGVVYALQWTNTNVSVVVFIGGIVLAGIVVNNAIVLVDYINQLRARGLSKRDAIVQAGTVRLRPILMTTLTTVLGLLPMALYSGEGAEMRKPMAITVVAGLSCATLLTLIIIPLVYDMFTRRDPGVESAGENVPARRPVTAEERP